MYTGLEIASILDEFHPFPTIFLNLVERLVRCLLIHEGVLAFEKKERSPFYIDFG